MDIPQSRQLKKLALGLLDEHEIEAHSGAPCPLERANLIGWLCHCLGINPGDPQSMLLIIERYEDFVSHHHDMEDK